MKRIITVCLVFMASLFILTSCETGELEVVENTTGVIFTTDMTAEDIKEYFDVYYMLPISSTQGLGDELTDYDVEYDFVEGICNISIKYKDQSYQTKVFVFDKDKFIYEGDFVFYPYKNKEYLIIYNGSEENLVLPERNEYVIYDYVFYKNQTLKSVDIGDSVTKIGAYAFYECTSLERVDFGNKLSEVCMYAFSLSTSINTVNADTIEDFCEVYFGGFSAMTDSFFGITFVGSSTVGGAVSGGTVSGAVSSGTVSSGGISVTITPTVGDYVGILPGVNITDVVIKWDEDNYKVRDGYVYKIEEDGTETVVAPYNVTNPVYFAGALYIGGTHLEDVVIPTSVTKIYPYAFHGADIKSVRLHGDLKIVSNNAFDNCDALDTIVVDSLGTNIVNTPLYGAIDDKFLVEYEGCKYFGNEQNPYMILVNVNKEKESIVIHPDTKAIGANAFESAFIYEIILPTGVEMIGKSAFGSVKTNLIKIGSSVKFIGAGAFAKQELANLSFDNANNWYYVDKDNKIYFNVDALSWADETILEKVDWHHD